MQRLQETNYNEVEIDGKPYPSLTLFNVKLLSVAGQNITSSVEATLHAAITLCPYTATDAYVRACELVLMFRYMAPPVMLHLRASFVMSYNVIGVCSYVCARCWKHCRVTLSGVHAYVHAHARDRATLLQQPQHDDTSL